MPSISTRPFYTTYLQAMHVVSDLDRETVYKFCALFRIIACRSPLIGNMGNHPPVHLSRDPHRTNNEGRGENHVDCVYRLVFVL